MAQSVISRTLCPNDIVLERIRSDTVTINPNSGGVAEVAITKPGYRPIAVSGYFKSGTATNVCFCYEYWFDDGTLQLAAPPCAKAYFRNTGTVQAVFTVDFIVTYIKV